MRKIPISETRTQLKKDFEQAILEAKIMEYHASGMSLAAIGKKVGLLLGDIYEIVQKTIVRLREQTEMDLASIRDVELQRCDRIQLSYWNRMLKGDPAAGMMVLKAMERRSKILGLDAPERKEWIGMLTAVTPEEASKMSDEELAARNDALKLKIEGAALKRVTGRVISHESQG